MVLLKDSKTYHTEGGAIGSCTCYVEHVFRIGLDLLRIRLIPGGGFAGRPNSGKD
jgi:hypothetical protein